MSYKDSNGVFYAGDVFNRDSAVCNYVTTSAANYDTSDLTLNADSAYTIAKGVTGTISSIDALESRIDSLEDLVGYCTASNSMIVKSMPEMVYGDNAIQTKARSMFPRSSYKTLHSARELEGRCRET